MLYVAVFLIVQLYSTQAVDFSFTSCTPPDSPLQLNSLTVTPSPVVVPGPVSLSLDAALTAPVDSSSLTVSLKRKTFLGEISIPCISHVGSCSYPDLCTILDTMETENWAGIMGNIGKEIRAMLNNAGVNPSLCPQPAQTLTLSGAVLNLPEVPAILSLFAEGDYHAHITVTENKSSRTILCLDAVLTIKEACSGLACLIG